jgi:hypothetical protein
MILVYNGVYQYKDPDFFYICSRLPCIFFSEDASALSKLMVTLRVKEADIVECRDVCAKAFNVINKWRENNCDGCISIVRDALHKVGLAEVDRRVFGHIVDQTLTQPEASDQCPDAQRQFNSPTMTSPDEGIPIEQADTPFSLAAEADSKVKAAQLVHVAEEIAGIWEELASHLSPNLFPIRKLKEIERDHRGSSFSQAQAMLEIWSEQFGSQATCRLLIQGLCRMGEREVASAVFGTDLVEFVERQ